MNKQFSIVSGDSIVLKGVPYSTVFVDPTEKKVYLYEKETTSINHKIITLQELSDAVDNDEAKIIPHVDSHIFIDPNNKKYLTRLNIVNRISAVYGPTFTDLKDKKRHPVIKEIIDELNVSRPMIWFTIRNYLQSGCDKSSLYPNHTGGAFHCDQKRRGRAPTKNPVCEVKLTPEIIQIFEEYKNMILGSRERSVHQAYVKMVRKYFSQEKSYTDKDGKVHFEKKPLPEAQIPTERQFKYWYYKSTTKKERDIARTSSREYRNDHRLLTGDTASGAIGPGYIFELDHNEFPVSLISVRSNDTVSNPIVSIALDAYSKAVTAVGIAFNNNSNIAYTNLMFNLAENKVDYCEKYDVELADISLWPSNVIPRIIRVDSGSDFISENTIRFCNENGIEIDPVTPGLGSLKPNVERFFSLLMQCIKSEIEKYGLITKRHDSNHHKKATLTIEDFRRIVINFIVIYNQSVLQNYSPDFDMIEAGIELSPKSLWEYGSRINPPRPIIDTKNYFYSLLFVDEKSYYSKDGVHFCGLRYLPDDKQFLEIMEYAKKTHVPFSVRYDPRDISVIYYVRDGRIKPMPLNTNYRAEKSFWGLSYDEVLIIKKKESEIKSRGRIKNRDLLGGFLDKTEQIVKEAKNRYALTPGTFDIKGNREVEKNNAAKAYSPSEKLQELFSLGTLPEKETEPAKQQKPVKKKESNQTDQQKRNTKKDMTPEEILELYYQMNRESF